MPENSEIKHLVETIAKSICDDVDAIHINEIEGTNSSILEVNVSQNDLGKMVGKKGKTATAIRTLVFAACFKSNKRYQVDINPT